MDTVVIVLASFTLYIIAYHTYGRFLSRRIFKIDPHIPTPACIQNDGVDFVPSKKSLVFGHHFTSIAGTGPIVGPAIAVVWGWVPALVWVTLGSIFMGAVHDFGSLIISMRHQGKTIADLSGLVLNTRVRLLFMLIVLMGLWIVLAIFGLVIATIFKLYPESVLPVCAQIPIAVALGIWMKRNGNLLVGSVVAVLMMYATIYWSASSGGVMSDGLFPSVITEHVSPIALWTFILMAYVFVASVLPVDVLLQPRDFINSWQLLIAMGLLVVGVFVAQPPIVAQAIRFAPEVSAQGSPAPPMFPFLFVTIACGAVSGFHCLVSSGCSSRQLKSEADAQSVGYGAMITEGFLATLVIIACVAGVGISAAGNGEAIWLGYYEQWGGDGGLGKKLAPFVQGSANIMESIGIPQQYGITLMGVFVASFAATTLDSATRLQRYVIAEVAGGSNPDTVHLVRKIMVNRFGATAIAVVSGFALALSDAPGNGLANAGLGALTLWPIFGATNQLLASIALLVITIWLVKLRRPAWVSAIPMMFMILMTMYAVVLLINDFTHRDNALLLGVSVAMLILQIWIVIEGICCVVSWKKHAPACSEGVDSSG